MKKDEEEEEEKEGKDEEEDEEKRVQRCMCVGGEDNPGSKETL